jgi:hypothetical protein
LVAAFALIAFAGMAAAISRQLSSPTDARHDETSDGFAGRDAAVAAPSSSRAALPPSLPALPTPNPTSVAPTQPQLAPPLHPASAEPAAVEQPSRRGTAHSKARSDTPLRAFPAAATETDPQGVTNFGGRR